MLSQGFLRQCGGSGLAIFKGCQSLSVPDLANANPVMQGMTTLNRVSLFCLFPFFHPPYIPAKRLTTSQNFAPPPLTVSFRAPPPQNL